MNFFNFDIRKLIVVTLTIVIALFLVKLHRTSKETPLVLRPFTFAAGLLQSGYYNFSSGVRGTTALYLNLVGLHKTNRELSKKNSELRAQLGTMNELKLENERLSLLLGFKSKSAMELLAGKVVGQDLLPGYSTITVNRGTFHGVTMGMAVLTVDGVVGYIFRPEVFTSQVLLLTDRSSAIDALVQRSRARGILEGLDSETCQLSFLKRDDDVTAGDHIVTSGLDNIFPKGFPIGVVTSVRRNQYGITQEVEISPAISPHNLEEVFIVLNAKSVDLETAPPENIPEGDDSAKIPGANKAASENP